MTVSPSTFEHRARRLAGVAVLLGALAGLLASIAIGEWSRRALFDEWQRLAPREIAADKVAVVLIDDASIDTIGSWPWPRYYMARLAEQISRTHPKAIGFDIVFPTPDAFSPGNFAALYPELTPASAREIEALPNMDGAFAQVIGSAPVVLSRLGVDGTGVGASQVLVDPPVSGSPPAGTLRTRRVLTSLPTLDDVALAHGLVNGPPDADGVVRRVPLTVIAGGQAMPGMAAELARVALDVPAMRWTPQGLVLGDRTLPVDRTGSLELRMGRFPLKAIYPADEVIAGRMPAAALAGRVVLIGMGAEGTSDIVPTPLSTTVLGVLVQAQAVDAIIGGGWLARPVWVQWMEMGLALVLLILVLFAGGRRRYWLLAVALAMAFALPLVSFVLFDRANLLFDPVRPIMVGAAAAIAMWIVLYILARIERTRLAAALVDQRVAAAEQEGELRAARRIQLGMVPGPERLAALDRRVQVGAVLRPAKSVGGDFYDAAMIAPDKLLFVIGDVTGKGVPAALYMALSKALSKSVLSRSGGALGGAMTQLNRDLMDEADDEMGVTMLAGLVDCATGELTMVNAGHENPLIVGADGRVAVVPLLGGPPLCVVDFPYPEETARLSPRGTLVLITDGATEAQDAHGGLFGIAGVVSALEQGVDVSARERAESLADRVRAFEGQTEPSDDLTIMALRLMG